MTTTTPSKSAGEGEPRRSIDLPDLPIERAWVHATATGCNRASHHKAQVRNLRNPCKRQLEGLAMGAALFSTNGRILIGKCCYSTTEEETTLR